MSDAFWAFGSLLKLGDDGTTETFTTIAELTDINGPSRSKDTIDVTSHDSVDGFREFLAGLKDNGEVGMSGNWVPGDATQDETTGILAAFEDDELHNFELAVPNDDTGITLSFAAIVMDHNVSLPMAEQGQFEATIKISGKISIA